MNPVELITRFRQKANLPAVDAAAGNATILGYCNEACRKLARKLVQKDSKQFEVFESINLVAGTQEYDTPRYFRDYKITHVERYNAAGDLIARLTYRRFQEKAFSVDPEWPNESGFSRNYYLRGRKFGLHVEPSESVTAGLKVYGIQLPPDMFWGNMPAIGADLTVTTFKMPATAVAGIRAGTLSTEHDYYVNATMRLLTNAARGFERTITDYSATTQVATVDTAWTAADVDVEQFVIMNPVAEQYPEAVVAYALKEYASSKGDRTLHMTAKDLLREWEDLFEGDVIPRHLDENDSMPIPDDDLMGA